MQWVKETHILLNHYLIFHTSFRLTEPLKMVYIKGKSKITVSHNPFHSLFCLHESNYYFLIFWWDPTCTGVSSNHGGHCQKIDTALKKFRLQLSYSLSTKINKSHESDSTAIAKINKKESLQNDCEWPQLSNDKCSAHSIVAQKRKTLLHRRPNTPYYVSYTFLFDYDRAGLQFRRQINSY